MLGHSLFQVLVEANQDVFGGFIRGIPEAGD